MTSLRDGPVFNFKYYIFREELFLAHGGEVPHEDLHGEQGKDCPTQPESSQRRKVLLPQDEPLRRPVAERGGLEHAWLPYGPEKDSSL